MLVPKSNLLIFLFLSIISVVYSCKPRSEDGEQKTLYNSGDIYAYGHMLLAPAKNDLEFLLKSKPGVNQIDSKEEFELVTANGEQVHFVDYHPTDRRPVFYSHSIVVAASKKRSDSQDVWFKLKRPAPSYKFSSPTFIYIGYTEKQGDQLKVKLYDQVNTSRVVIGDQSGKIALHYADDQIRGRKYDRNYCSVILGLSENLRSQTPSDFDPEQCNELPNDKDICDGKPSDTDCLPEFHVGFTDLKDKGLELDGAKMLKISHDRYRLVGDEVVGVVALRDSNNKSLKNEKNERYAFHTRSASNLQNDKCHVEFDPVKSFNGQDLIFNVVFTDAQTYEYKVCNLLVEDLENGATDYLQIIKR